MKRLLLGLIAATVLATTHAFAADLWAPPPMPYKAPPPVAPPVWSWTGFYLGLDVGAAWATDAVSPLVDDGGTVFPRTNSISTSGPLGGATAGFNYQFGSFLLGVEGDIGVLAIANSKPDLALAGETDSINDGMYGDATGRVGFVWGPALLYGKGGWAFFNGRADTTLIGFSSTQTNYFTGWTWGGGAEYRLGGPWSAKVEYLHFMFGTQDSTLTSLATGDVFPYGNKLTVDTVKFGLNYQFGMSPMAPFYPSGPIFTKD
jgi:outer membrane immunogenic protein